MPQLDVEFFRPFIVGTISTLKIQCSIDAKPGKPFIKGQGEQPQFQLAGIIGIISDTFNGSIILCFPSHVFLGIMNSMLGETFATISDELQSGVAELLNIIYGSAKVVLNEQGYAIQMAIPSVVSGAGLKTTHLASSPVIVIPFHTAIGEFNVEIAVEGKRLV